MKNSKIIKIIKNIWVLVVIVGAGYYVYSNRRDFYSYLSNIETWRLLSSMALLLGARILLYFQSQFSLSCLGETIPFRKLFSILSLTQLGKYLPGGIWHIVGQFGMYRTNKLSNLNSGKAMLLENIWIVFSALYFGLAFLFLSGSFPNGKYDILPIKPEVYIPILIAAILVIWIYSIYLSLRFLAPTNPNQLIFSLKIFVFQFINWLLFGLSFVILFEGLSVDHSDVLLGIGGFAIGWVGGYLAFFAPGGVGIRELILAFLLSPFLTVANVSTVAIVHRLVWTIAEIITGLAGWALEKTQLSDPKPSDVL